MNKNICKWCMELQDQKQMTGKWEIKDDELWEGKKKSSIAQM